MADYSNQSWDKLCFCITPRELEQVLEGFHLMTISGPVLRPSVQAYAGDYAALLERLQEPEAMTDRTLDSRLGSMGYFRELPENGTDSPEQLRRKDPFTYMETFNLTCWPMAGRMTLSTAFGNFPDPRDVVGLQLLCPKTVVYRQEDGYSPPVSTEDLECWKTYTTLKKRIQAITKPLKAELEGREVRTRIRVSQAMLEQLDQLYFFRTNPVRVIR